MPDYLNMTHLPEALERALLLVPPRRLAEACGWALASDPYTSIQRLAVAKTEKDLWRLAKGAGLPLATPADPVETPVPAAVRPAAPTVRGRITPETIVRRLPEGKSRITPGSLRARVHGLLVLSVGGARTVQQLQQVLGFDPRPVIGKLIAAGWVEIDSK